MNYSLSVRKTFISCRRKTGYLTEQCIQTTLTIKPQPPSFTNQKRCSQATSGLKYSKKTVFLMKNMQTVANKGSRTLRKKKKFNVFREKISACARSIRFSILLIQIAAFIQLLQWWISPEVHDLKSRPLSFFFCRAVYRFLNLQYGPAKWWPIRLRLMTTTPLLGPRPSKAHKRLHVQNAKAWKWLWLHHEHCR